MLYPYFVIENLFGLWYYMVRKSCKAMAESLLGVMPMFFILYLLRPRKGICEDIGSFHIDAGICHVRAAFVNIYCECFSVK